jgi:hypothetical protein
MMLLDGHPRNITQMTINLLVGRLQFKRMVLHHNLVLCGMKHLVITMMLLRASTLMEIQVPSTFLVWFVSSGSER